MPSFLSQALLALALLSGADAFANFQCDQATSASDIEYKPNAGWCDSNLDEYIGDFNSVGECYDACVTQYPNTIAVDYTPESKSCYCEDDCKCMNAVGQTGTGIKAGCVLPPPCGWSCYDDCFGDFSMDYSMMMMMSMDFSMMTSMDFSMMPMMSMDYSMMTSMDYLMMMYKSMCQSGCLSDCTQPPGFDATPFLGTNWADLDDTIGDLDDAEIGYTLNLLCGTNPPARKLREVASPRKPPARAQSQKLHKMFEVAMNEHHKK